MSRVRLPFPLRIAVFYTVLGVLWIIISDRLVFLLFPDPEILTRAHVALPLADLDPAFVHPLAGETLGEIAARFAGTPGVRLHRLTLLP